MSHLLILSSLSIAGVDEVFDVVGEGLYFRCVGVDFCDRVREYAMSSVSFLS